VLETIGESIGCSVSASNEFLNVKKELGAAASTKIEISSIQDINTIDGDYVVVMLSTLTITLIGMSTTSRLLNGSVRTDNESLMA
jgi:predicted aspartyl protease